jgi:ATPase family associated with various cellular activities (AAA)
MLDNLSETIKINPITLIIGNPLERQYIKSALGELSQEILPIDSSLVSLPPGTIVIENYLSYLNIREPAAKIRAYSDLQDRYFENRADQSRLILLETAEKFTLPPDLERFVKTYRIPLPDQCQIERIYLNYELEVNDRTIGFGRGLTKPELEIAIEEAKCSGQDIWQYIDRFRSHKLGLLGLKCLPTPPKRQVGGLDLIMATIPKIKYCISPEGIQRGLPTPKGLLLAGLPGTGKTYLAETFGSELGLPMFALSVDLICDGGAPVLAKALETIESLAPCMLFVDEFDKLCGNGIDRQVLGVFLSWLQDHVNFVYVFATMNRISTTPPELTRTGRFDDVFGLEFPLPNSRLHLFEIYLGMFDRKYTDLITACTETELRLLAENTNYFLASDIAQLVYKVIINLGMQGIVDISVENVIQQAKTFSTLYRRDPDSILEMLNEIKGKCSPAESDSNKYISSRKINAY